MFLKMYAWYVLTTAAVFHELKLPLGGKERSHLQSGGEVTYLSSGLKVTFRLECDLFATMSKLDLTAVMTER